MNKQMLVAARIVDVPKGAHRHKLGGVVVFFRFFPDNDVIQYRCLLFSVNSFVLRAVWRPRMLTILPEQAKENRDKTATVRKILPKILDGSQGTNRGHHTVFSYKVRFHNTHMGIPRFLLALLC